MNQVILASHGGMSSGLRDTVELIVGEVPNVHAISTTRDETEPMPKVETLNENIMFIFGNVATLRAFCKGYPKIKEINYGGQLRLYIRQNALPAFITMSSTVDVFGRGFSSV